MIEGMKRTGLALFKANSVRLLTAILVIGFASANCAAPEGPAPAPAASRFLYVSSGSCFSGVGNTTFANTTSSNLVFRINITTGAKDAVVADYNSSPSQTGDSPVAMVDADASNIYVLVENTTTAGARRIEKIAKKANGSRSLFSNNTTALSSQLRSMQGMSNGDLLISKSTAVERITSSNVRLLNGANPYISAPTAPCATSTNLVSKTLSLKNEFIVFLHAAVGQNRFGIVKPTGFNAAGDCPVAQNAPNAASYPVAAAYDSVNSKLIVAYAGNATTTDLNSIYTYDITESAGSVAIGAANRIYDSSLYPATYPYLLYGISDMIYDAVDKKIYIATANNTSTTISNYTIEKFSYDASQIGGTNTVLTRVGTIPFYNYGSDTKCIADMMIAN